MPDRRISSLQDLKPGDHIKYDCILQEKKKKILAAMHHALVVNVENDAQLMVIHNDGQNVEEELMTIDPNYITVVDYDCVYSGIEAIKRARKRLGDSYNFFSDNCEHFVTWARTGKGESKQVKKGTGAGLVGLAGGAVAGAAIGSFVPVVGTVAGGIVGGALGMFGGVSISTTPKKSKSS